MILTAGASGEVLTLASLLLYACFERNMFVLMHATDSLVPIANARPEPSRITVTIFEVTIVARKRTGSLTDPVASEKNWVTVPVLVEIRMSLTYK